MAQFLDNLFIAETINKKAGRKEDDQKLSLEMSKMSLLR